MVLCCTTPTATATRTTTATTTTRQVEAKRVKNHMRETRSKPCERKRKIGRKRKINAHYSQYEKNTK